jgi:tRNA pseudouridine38-40 synthase
MRYSIRLSYDGSAFCGWQIQNNARTVQGELEKALSTLLGTAISIVGAGRTDSEVNAINYIAHFDTSDEVSINAEQLCYKLNAILPREVAVHEVSATKADFHARFDARSREYHYFIHFRKDPFCEKYSYRMRYPLDMDRMNEAAKHLLGEHDFSCFEKVGGNNATSICTITEAAWSTYTPDHAKMMGYPCQPGDYIVFKIRANRFLRNMVRAVVGTLFEVGRGAMTVSEMRDAVHAHNRCAAGQSMPPDGLYLTNIRYPERIFL